eukprot:1678896-Rhodomonas_salina.3
MPGSNGGEAILTTTSLQSPLARCQCGNCDYVVTSPSGCWSDAFLGRVEHWPYGKGGWDGITGTLSSTADGDRTPLILGWCQDGRGVRDDTPVRRSHDWANGGSGGRTLMGR